MLGTFFAWRQYDDAKGKALDDMRARVVLASTVFDTYFAGQIATLSSIANSPSVVDQDKARMATYFKRVQKEGGSADVHRRPRLDRSRRQLPRLRPLPERLGVERRRPRVLQGRDGDREAVHQRRARHEGRPAPGRDHGGADAGRGRKAQRRADRGAGAAPVGTSQRTADLGFSNLVLIDRAGQQLTLASFGKPENTALLARIRKGDGVLGDTTGLNGGGGRVVAYANSVAPRWTIAFDRARSAVFASARRSFVIEMISILVAAAIVLAIVGWAIARSRREIAAEQEQIRRWDELGQSLGEASAAAEVATALGDSLATAFPRAHVVVGLQDDETGGFTTWTFGGGDAGPVDRRTPGLVEIARLGYLSRSPLRITQPEAVGTVLSPLDETLVPPPGSVYALPMHSAAGRTIGSVTLLLPHDEVLHDSDHALLAAHTDYAARALGRARHSEREHDVATALQRSLLPDELPVVEGLGLAGRYNAGAVGLEVGGDWYDAVRRPDGIVHISVGDVAGRGVSAAVLMGQLRNSFRALAYEHTSPAEIARRLTQIVPDTSMATATFLALDPYTGELRYSSAGHPPSLLLDAVNGEVTMLDEASAPPLGWTDTRAIREARLTLRSRMTLLAYTDGLVERRGTDIDEGIARAADALRLRPERGADDTADALLETFVRPSEASDDIALFVLQVDDVPAAFRVEIPADPRVVRELRARLKAWLERRGLTAEQVGDTVLAVSEACNNAIEHGYDGDFGMIRITLEHRAGRPSHHGRGRRGLEGGSLRPDARPRDADHEPDDGLRDRRPGADRDAGRPGAAPGALARVRELHEPADGRHEPHLLHRPAVDVEQRRRAREHGPALGARRGDVEAVPVEGEPDPARRVLGRRARHRDDDHRRLLALELVDRAHRHRGRELRPQRPHLGVVGRDDEDVLVPERARAVVVGERRPDEPGDEAPRRPRPPRATTGRDGGERRRATPARSPPRATVSP